MPYKDPKKQREYQRNYQQKWREMNREKVRGYWQKYYYSHYTEIRKRKNQQNRKSEQTYQVRARRHHRYKIEVLKRYGGNPPKCANCGEQRYECLQIDHITDDGWKERKKIPSGENFYSWLRKQPYQPNKYQVLCANCNAIKRTRGLLSYKGGLKTIEEWEEWAKSKRISTPPEIKKIWLQRKE